jgi:hypothetical protein
MWYFILGFILGSYCGRLGVNENYKYYEGLYFSRENEITQYKKFITDKKLEEEYTNFK